MDAPSRPVARRLGLTEATRRLGFECRCSISAPRLPPENLDYPYPIACVLRSYLHGERACFAAGGGGAPQPGADAVPRAPVPSDLAGPPVNGIPPAKTGGQNRRNTGLPARRAYYGRAPQTAASTRRRSPVHAALPVALPRARGGCLLGRVPPCAGCFWLERSANHPAKHPAKEHPAKEHPATTRPTTRPSIYLLLTQNLCSTGGARGGVGRVVTATPAGSGRLRARGGRKTAAAPARRLGSVRGRHILGPGRPSRARGGRPESFLRPRSAMPSDLAE
jgi:hypothetical protein